MILLQQLIALVVSSAAPISKALAGALGGALVSWLAQQGVSIDPEGANALEVALAALVTGVIVWAAPRNRKV